MNLIFVSRTSYKLNVADTSEDVILKPYLTFEDKLACQLCVPYHRKSWIILFYHFGMLYWYRIFGISIYLQIVASLSLMWLIFLTLALPGHRTGAGNTQENVNRICESKRTGHPR